MEEEVNFIESNLTTPGDVDFEMVTLKYIHDGFLLTAALIGFVCDCLLVYVIVRNKQMRTRTNIMIMNLAITDALFLLSTPALFTYFADLMNTFAITLKIYCVVAHTDATYQFASMLFIDVIITGSIINSTKFSNKAIVIFVYTLVAVTSIINIVLCMESVGIPILYLVVTLFFLGSLLAMFVKEIIKCCKRNSDPMSQEDLVRLNIGRIYIYTWFLSVVFLFLGYPNLLPKVLSITFQYFYLVGFLTSLLIIVYLAYTERNFKICLLNIFRRDENKYNVDATISFADECRETGFVNPGVNINFNEHENNKPAVA